MIARIEIALRKPADLRRDRISANAFLKYYEEDRQNLNAPKLIGCNSCDFIKKFKVWSDWVTSQEEMYEAIDLKELIS